MGQQKCNQLSFMPTERSATTHETVSGRNNEVLLAIHHKVNFICLFVLPNGVYLRQYLSTGCDVYLRTGARTSQIPRYNKRSQQCPSYLAAGVAEA